MAQRAARTLPNHSFVPLVQLYKHAIAWCVALAKAVEQANPPRYHEYKAWKPQARRSSGKNAQAAPHDFRWTGHYWQCQECPVTERQSKSPVDRRPCSSHLRLFLDGLMDTFPTLRVVQTRYRHIPIGHLVFCTHCGCSAQHQVRNLAGTCTWVLRLPEEQVTNNFWLARARYRQIRQGFHPLPQ